MFTEGLSQGHGFCGEGRQTDELEGQGGQGAHMGLGVGPGIQLL